MQIYISGIVFALLVVLIGSRALFMYKQGIKAIVFGRTDKSDFLLLPVVLFFFGMFLVHRNILIALAVILFHLAIHRQILREEAFLKKHYGGEYEEYCRKVRRYL